MLQRPCADLHRNRKEMNIKRMEEMKHGKINKEVRK
jgi:hypothetical protein